MAAATFADRADAGRRLGAALRHLRAGEGEPRPLVLGLPRGGVVVAAAVADALDADLDVLVVAKVRLPWQPELALGAVASGGVRVVNEHVVRQVRPDPAELDAAWRTATDAVEARERDLRAGTAPASARGRTVVVVDDGLATGATARAALRAVRAMGARRTVLAVPIAPAEAVEELSTECDEVVALVAHPRFSAVSVAYRDFAQTDDAAVRQALGRGGPPGGAAP